MSVARAPTRNLLDKRPTRRRKRNSHAPQVRHRRGWSWIDRLCLWQGERSAARGAAARSPRTDARPTSASGNGSNARTGRHHTAPCCSAGSRCSRTRRHHGDAQRVRAAVHERCFVRARSLQCAIPEMRVSVCGSGRLCRGRDVQHDDRFVSAGCSTAINECMQIPLACRVVQRGTESFVASRPLRGGLRSIDEAADRLRSSALLWLFGTGERLRVAQLR